MAIVAVTLHLNSPFVTNTGTVHAVASVSKSSSLKNSVHCSSCSPFFSTASVMLRLTASSVHSVPQCGALHEKFTGVSAASTKFSFAAGVTPSSVKAAGARDVHSLMLTTLLMLSVQSVGFLLWHAFTCQKYDPM